MFIYDLYIWNYTSNRLCGNRIRSQSHLQCCLTLRISYSHNWNWFICSDVCKPIRTIRRNHSSVCSSKFSRCDCNAMLISCSYIPSSFALRIYVPNGNASSRRWRPLCGSKIYIHKLTRANVCEVGIMC